VAGFAGVVGVSDFVLLESLAAGFESPVLLVLEDSLPDFPFCE
jgi:hypothetical protein